MDISSTWHGTTVRMLTLVSCVLIVMIAVSMPRLALSQEADDDCKEGYERLPGAKECTPIEWDGPILDPGLLETPGFDPPIPVLIQPTPVPTLPDLTTPRSDETPAAPTVVPSTLGTITIEVLTCPRWYLRDDSHGLIPPCGPLPGAHFSLISDGVVISTGVAVGSKDPSVPARITFREVPAGKVLMEQEPISGQQSIRVFCGKGNTPMSLSTPWSAGVELLPGEHLTCSFVNVAAK